MRDYFDEIIDYDFQSERDDTIEEVPKEQKIVISDDKTVATNKLISEFEQKVRGFIKIQLEKSYGEDWWNQCIPQDVKEMAEKRIKGKLNQRENIMYLIFTISLITTI